MGTLDTFNNFVYSVHCRLPEGINLRARYVAKVDGTADVVLHSVGLAAPLIGFKEHARYQAVSPQPLLDNDERPVVPDLSRRIIPFLFCWPVTESTWITG
jgi:hypothetical protein